MRTPRSAADRHTRNRPAGSPAWKPQATLALLTIPSMASSSPSRQTPKPSPKSALRSIQAIRLAYCGILSTSRSRRLSCRELAGNGVDDGACHRDTLIRCAVAAGRDVDHDVGFGGDPVRAGVAVGSFLVDDRGGDPARGDRCADRPGVGVVVRGVVGDVFGNAAVPGIL